MFRFKVSYFTERRRGSVKNKPFCLANSLLLSLLQAAAFLILVLISFMYTVHSFCSDCEYKCNTHFVPETHYKSFSLIVNSISTIIIFSGEHSRFPHPPFSLPGLSERCILSPETRNLFLVWSV